MVFNSRFSYFSVFFFFFFFFFSSRRRHTRLQGDWSSDVCSSDLVAFDSRNDLYICDSGSNRNRKVDHETGIITTIIGTGQHGFNGDGPAISVNLTWPAAIAFDPNDVMYIADTQAHRIRCYDPRTGIVTTVAGTWTAEDEAR